MNSSRNPYPAGSVLAQLYQKYHDAGFSPAYMLQYFAPTACCAVVSMLLNFSLVWVTIKRRSSLNSTFGIFIAFESFSAFLFSFGYFLNFVVVALCGQNVVTYPTCILTKIATTYGVYMQTGMMLFISLERFACLVFPLWYNYWGVNSSKCYIVIAILLCFSYGTFMMVSMIQGRPENWAEKDFLCNFNDWYGPSTKALLYTSVVYTEIPIIAIYGIIWLMMLKATIMRVKLTNTYNMHIMKSLSVIMALIMAGYVLNGASVYFIPLLGLSPMNSLMPGVILSSITITAAAGNGPILYIFSSQYRNCYRQVFPWLNKSGQSTTTVQVIPIRTSTRTMTTVNQLQTR